MIGCALIGCGYWGSKLKRYIEESKVFNLKYVCNSKSDLNEVWNDREVSAVVVATPNNTHYAIVRDALLAGKDVLAEKPLAMTRRQCEDLDRLAREKELAILTEYTYTFSRALQMACYWVGSKRIGELRAAEMSVKHLGRFGGGSVYWLLGSHMLSVLDMFVPLKDLNFWRRDLVIHNGEVETGSIMFTGEMFTGEILVSLNYPPKETRIILYGSKGTIRCTFNSFHKTPLELWRYKRKKWTPSDELSKSSEVFLFDEKHNLKYAIDAFYDVLTEGRATNIETAIKITGVLEEIQDESSPS